MEFYPFIYEKPKQVDNLIPLQIELDDPYLAPPPKKEDVKEKTIIIVIEL